jgi:ABC-type uncharacterized transport system substrate-binding protein
MAQSDFGQQLLLIKEIMPEATKAGIFYNTDDQRAPMAINRASAEAGITLVTAPVKSIREMAKAMRALKQHRLDFYVIFDDRVTGGPNSIKFVVRQTVKYKKPVYTSSSSAFKSGAFGKFIKQGAGWTLQINGKVLNLFDITIPSDDKRFAVINEG